MNAPAINKNHPPVGIDLGTTYSVVAFLDETGRSETILNDTGDTMTPSCILFDDDLVVVGKEAQKCSVMMADAYAECFKRDMGQRFFRDSLSGATIPAEILSAFVLENLRKVAERRLGPVRDVVITVPAFFDEQRRRATQKAGQLAGLNVLDIINEPTAAAIAYGYRQGLDASQPPADQTVLVYDLGGGTFDVSILKVEDRTFRCLATDGDVRLGGKDFDARLIDFLAEQFLAAKGLDPRLEDNEANQLWLDAQEIKHTLSQRKTATSVIRSGGARHRVEVTRDQFEELTRDLLARTESTCQLVLKQAHLEWDAIDRVLLVGGSSRMPMVESMLGRVSGQDVDRSLGPDEAIAHGAAIYAGLLQQQTTQPQDRSPHVVNVNSHSLGVVGLDPKTKRHKNQVLIPRNTPIPHRERRRFRTAKGGQRNVVVNVVEGESSRPDECIALGRCMVDDLPSDLPMGTPVDVEYHYQADGTIEVRASLPSIRFSAEVAIDRAADREAEDLETWRARLLGMQRDPQPADSQSALDPQAAMRRLDTLYVSIGQAAAPLKLPRKLRKSGELLQQTATQAADADAAVERARQVLASGQDAQRPHLEQQLQAAQRRADELGRRIRFHHLVLGRDCYNAGWLPPGTEQLTKQIEALLAILQTD